MGTATVELVPCYESGDWPDDLGTKWVRVSSGRLSLYDGDGAAYEINEALPFGPWTPGGPAAIVTDYRDTIDCPNDCARFDGRARGHTRGSNWDWVPCGVCDGAKTLSGPLSWSDAPTSPCITTIDLKENAA